MLKLPKELTNQQFCAALPDGIAAIGSGTREGQRICAMLRRGLGHLILQELMSSIRHGYRGRNRDDMQNYYETSYADSAERVAADYGEVGRRVLYRFSDSLLAEVEARHMLCMLTQHTGNIIEALRPESLCELGCGHGRSLLYLANRLQSVPCTGIELTTSGVEMARQLQQIDLPNTGYGRLYGLTRNGMDNVRRANFIQASAFDLPVADRAYDVVLTFAAIEQMQTGYERALSEIRRVARRYVLFYEPFADGNDVLQRIYLWSRNYFRIRIDALRSHGFVPIKIWKRVPVKPTFAFTFALCRPA